MNIEMELQVKFNREVDLEKDYICPGGYEMIMNGKNVQFDFHCVDTSDCFLEPTLCTFNVKDADYEAFPEFKKITASDLKNISSIEECFVYTGESGESDLEVVSIEKITFLLLEDKLQVIDVPQNLIDEYNKTLQAEKKNEKGVYEIRLTPKELKNKIMAQQLTFYSKFLDIPLEDLCGYTKEQLERMIESTIEQMPDDLLRQFEIELAGGKREF